MSGGLSYGCDAYYDGILPSVERPSRYIDRELNLTSNGFTDGHYNVLLVFPDVYEIGMSHLGFRILYSLLNNREATAAERVGYEPLGREIRPPSTLQHSEWYAGVAIDKHPSRQQLQNQTALTGKFAAKPQCQALTRQSN